MLVLELLTWALLGFLLGLVRLLVFHHATHTGRILKGATVSAIFGGGIGHVVAPGALVPNELSGTALLLAGAGAVVFLVLEWIVTHRRPSMHA